MWTYRKSKRLFHPGPPGRTLPLAADHGVGCDLSASRLPATTACSKAPRDGVRLDRALRRGEGGSLRGSLARRPRDGWFGKTGEGRFQTEFHRRTGMSRRSVRGGHAAGARSRPTFLKAPTVTA